MPLAKAPIATVAILLFLFCWNDFFLALVLLRDAGTYTLPVGIAQFIGQYSTPYELVAAAVLIAAVPGVHPVSRAPPPVRAGRGGGSGQVRGGERAMDPDRPLAAMEQIATGIDHAEGICLAPDGTCYVSGEQGQIYRVDEDGAAHEVTTTGGWTLGLAADARGPHLRLRPGRRAP